MSTVWLLAGTTDSMTNFHVASTWETSEWKYHREERVARENRQKINAFRMVCCWEWTFNVGFDNFCASSFQLEPLFVSFLCGNVYESRWFYFSFGECFARSIFELCGTLKKWLSEGKKMCGGSFIWCYGWSLSLAYSMHNTLGFFAWNTFRLRAKIFFVFV